MRMWMWRECEGKKRKISPLTPPSPPGNFSVLVARIQVQNNLFACWILRFWRFNDWTVLYVYKFYCILPVWISTLKLINYFPFVHRNIQGVCLQPLACCDRGFESHRGHGCLSVVSVVCCQVQVSATSRSLVHRSPTDCGASLCVI